MTKNIQAVPGRSQIEVKMLTCPIDHMARFSENLSISVITYFFSDHLKSLNGKTLDFIY